MRRARLILAAVAVTAATVLAGCTWLAGHNPGSPGGEPPPATVTPDPGAPAPGGIPPAPDPAPPTVTVPDDPR